MTAREAIQSRMAAITIRRARLDESQELTELALRSKAHWGYDRAFLDRARPELEFRPAKFLPEFHVYVLEVEGNPAGFCSLILSGADVVELHDLFVEPRHIGRGYGKALWDYAVAVARSQGFRKLVLTADPNAEPFYARQGAVRTGEKASPVEAGRSLPVMEYSLSGE